MEFKDLDLIDLITERHLYIRSEIERRWNEQNELKMNNTEWHVLTKLYSGLNTIADITRKVHVTRQATHKLIKNLEQKELIKIYDDEQNKKIKKVCLTELGIVCYEQYLRIKNDLETSIMSRVGSTVYDQMMQGLQKDWS